MAILLGLPVINTIDLKGRFTFIVAVVFFLMGQMGFSETSSAPVAFVCLKAPDPMLSFLTARQCLYLLSALQLLLSAFLLVGGPEYINLKIILISWLGTSLLVYHVGLFSASRPDLLCSLDGLTNNWALRPGLEWAAFMTVTIVATLGSYVFLILWWRRCSSVNRHPTG